MHFTNRDGLVGWTQAPNQMHIFLIRNVLITSGVVLYIPSWTAAVRDPNSH
jgi:hypothetical protein